MRQLCRRDDDLAVELITLNTLSADGFKTVSQTETVDQ
jgi:hypothetical protein